MSTCSARCVILGLVVGAALAAAGPALGDSSTIAGEPTVVLGQQEFGNASDDSTIDYPWSVSYWGLPVIAGDRVAIDWEVNATEAQSFALYAEPVGTQDGLSVVGLSSHAVATTEVPEDPQLHAAERFIASQTGVMPLAFTIATIDTGPYDFTANVLHRVDMRLSGAHRIARTGTLRVQARDPDGRPLTVPTLTIRLQRRVSPGHWATIGTASPRNGGAHVHYVLPARLRGRVVHLRAQASGGGYFTRVTVGRAVRVS
jgi:hypothetical protein